MHIVHKILPTVQWQTVGIYCDLSKIHISKMQFTQMCLKLDKGIRSHFRGDIPDRLLWESPVHVTKSGKISAISARDSARSARETTAGRLGADG